MAETKPFFTRVEKSTLAYGSRLAVRCAFVGSIVFGVCETVTTWINTYWIQHIESSFDSKFLSFDIFFFVMTVVLGFILASLPAWIFGRLLAFILFQDAWDQLRRGNAALLTGMAIGAIAGFAPCLPILMIQFLVIFPTGHGDPYVFIYRTFTAVLIAACSGAWVSRKLVLRYGGAAPSHSPL